MSEDISQAGEAQKADLQVNFAYWNNCLNIAEASMGEYGGTGEIPDAALPEGMNPIWDIKKLIKEDPDLDAISRYFEMSVREERVFAQIGGREARSAGSKFGDLLYLFEDQNIAEFIAQEAPDGVLHQGLVELLDETSATSDVMTNPVKTLRDVFGFESAVELMGVNGNEFSNHVREVLKTPNAMKWVHYVDRSATEAEGEMEWKEYKEWYRGWMATGLASYLGIDETESYEYVFSAAVNTEPADILDIAGKFDHFGLDEIRKLSEFTGIHGLEAYSTEQLQRMVEFTNDPEAVASKLAEHDVIVSMVNRVGDHNGVLRNTAQDVDDETGRVLFFEINNMSDIYRRAIALSKVGVHPSTIILAAHSNEGRFMVSDNRDRGLKKVDVAAVAARRVVEMVNNSDDKELNPNGQRGYSMHGMRGMVRLVDDLMAPSRAIDDDVADRGRKKIIFSACYSGKEIDVKDLDASGERVVVGRDSVASRLVNDLAEMGSRSAVDIYGGPEGIQMHRTEHGLRYSGSPSVEGEMFERTKLHAVQMRLQGGKVTKREVDEILLRKGVA